MPLAFLLFGEEDYLLVVQEEQGQEMPVVCYYEPIEKIAYNYSEERDDPACEMALLFLQAEGGMRFSLAVSGWTAPLPPTLP